MRVTTADDFCGPVRQSGDQLNYKLCPVCGSDSWKVYLDPSSGRWMCFAGQHGAGGRVDMGLPVDDPGAVMEHMVRTQQTGEYDPPEIALPEWEGLGMVEANYMQQRGMTVAQALKHGIVKRMGSPRVLIPVYQDGKLVYWTSRLTVPENHPAADGPKYLSAPVRHPLAVYGEGTECLYVVEGIFDAIAFAETDAGCTAVALLGKTLPNYLRKNFLTLARKYGTIYIVLDSDAPYHAFKLQRTLEPLVDEVQVLTMPKGDDPADLFRRGELGDWIVRNV